MNRLTQLLVAAFAAFSLASCGSSPSLEPAVGSWVMEGYENDTGERARNMTIRDDGGISAQFPERCTGKATTTKTDRSYRFDIDCPAAKVTMDGTLAEDGQTLTLVDPNRDLTLRFKRRPAN